MKLNILIVSAMILLPLSQANAKSMEQFYGSEKYHGTYDFNDLKRSTSRDSVHESRVGYKGLSAYGRHANVEIMECSSGEIIAKRQKVRQSVTTIAKKDDPLALEALSACQYYHDFMIEPENDEEENLKISVEGLAKWRILREPLPLRRTRHRIYFNERAVKILDRRIKRTHKKKKLKLLKLVRKFFKKKAKLLHRKHNHIMTHHDLPWRPRRWVWANMKNDSAYCYKGESFNPVIWFEVKQKISRVQKRIRQAMGHMGQHHMKRK